MDEDMKRRLLRYVDEYGWGWGLTCSLINVFCGTEYTVRELQKIYHETKYPKFHDKLLRWRYRYYF